jgi:type I restriction enzyme R subunit
MSNFAFLAAEFPAVHEAAVEAERQAGVSPTAAAFFAGKAVEVAVKWAFRADPNLKLPYQDNIAALLHEPTFRRAAGKKVFAKARYINTLRNRAVHVEGGDRLGKTIVFAKNQAHAQFIEARFNAAYPNLAGHFARVITYESGAYAQTLIDDFSKKNAAPHIAISVDMLDTGIDVPEVVNLVFFKPVRSKTKFWQMMGRGTRLCPDLFGPGQDKELFRVFDFCQNLEFFGANPELKEAGGSKSLSERLFAARLDLVRALDDKRNKDGGFSAGEQEPYEGSKEDGPPPSEEEIRADAVKTLQTTVAGLNLENFIVRQHRRAVEKYLKPEAWHTLDDTTREELIDEIAPLPSANVLGTEEAKRFDLLMFSLQVAVLKGSKRFDTLRKQLLEIAAALESQTGIPAIAHQAALIEEIQTEQWWEGITVPLLELVRLRLRDLVQHIEKSKRAIVYSNFSDEIGDGVELDLPQVGEVDFVRFKQKARQFLKANENHLVVHKLRQGKPLTPTDLAELERMLLDAGIGDAADIERARETSQGLGRFIRSLVGLDRAAASAAFGEFLSSGTASASQIEFINMIIEHLTHQGVMDPSLLYEQPFTTVAPTGPEQLFDESRTARLFKTIEALNDSAVA